MINSLIYEYHLHTQYTLQTKSLVKIKLNPFLLAGIYRLNNAEAYL